MASPAEPRLFPWRRWLWVFGTATFLALFFATKFYYTWRASGVETTWTKHLWWQGMEWYAWALFSPAIFWFCEKLDHRQRGFGFFLFHLGTGVAFALLHVAVLTTGARVEAWVFDTGYGWEGLARVIVRNHFHSDLFTYAALVSVWHAASYYRKLKQREIETIELSNRLSQAQLQALKTQLQPHFLFNTLNGIAELNYENPRAANRMLSKLSELLRLCLASSTTQEITLEQELQFNRHYLELEQIRLGERLRVDLEIAPETLEAQVPALLLQPLVENAIRHGIAPFAKPGTICIESRREEGELHLRITDSGPGPGADQKNQTSGVGLSNTRARLQQLYGRDHHLELSSGKNGGFAVSIVIPFRGAISPASINEYSHVNS